MSALQAKKIAENLAAFLKTHQFSHLLPDVISHLQILEAKRQEQERFVIRTAYGISPTLVEEIRSYMGVPKDAAVSLEEDTNLMGGFVARYGEKVYDASHAHGLQLLTKTLLT